MTHRTEYDLLGPIHVPLHALFGGQTQRAIDNFPLNGQSRLGDWPTLVRALLQIKQAAALANRDAGFLPPSIANAIISAASTLSPADYPAHFPIHSLHGGGGTSANMNTNEVLANLANQSLSSPLGQYLHVHPNDHVNLHQSTNDIYPSACHLAVIAQAAYLDASLAHLSATIESKISLFGAQPRLARTCLQDAVTVTFADTLSGYTAMLARQRQRIAGAITGLHHINLTGTIVGRPSDAPDAYKSRVFSALQAITGIPTLAPCQNLFDGAQNIDDLASVSASLDLAARSIAKLAQDLRLLSSGPDAGLGEVNLPALQPGSSIMPGKVNPVIPEHVMHLCFRITALDAGARQAINHGELDLNIWESLVAIHVLESMTLLQSAAQALADRCIQGMTINPGINDAHTQALMPLLTELCKKHSYSKVSAICRQAGQDREKLRQLLKTHFSA